MSTRSGHEEHYVPLASYIQDNSSEVTVLRVAQKGKIACKTFRPKEVIPYNAGVWFLAERNSICGISTLSKLLLTLESDPSAFVVRGRLRSDHDGVELVKQHEAEGTPEFQTLYRTGIERIIHRNITLRRTKYLESVASRLLCVDIDDIEAPLKQNSTSPEAVEYAIGLLGDEFRDVSHHYQFSSSARPDNPKIKLHLWFWMDRPVGNEDLRRWAKTKNGRVDSALYTSVQPHYTAVPLFDGVPDPLPNGRSRLVTKASDVLALIIPEEAVREPRSDHAPVEHTGTAEQWLDRISDPEFGIHQSARQATWEYVREHGQRGSAEFVERVKQAICEAPGGRSSADIERHCKDAERAMETALQKVPVGRKPIAMVVQPRMPLLSVSTGRAQVSQLVGSFLERPRDVAIKVTAGTGKTTIAARQIAPGLAPDKVLHWFVPTHELGEATAQLLSAANPHLAIKVVKGRNQENCAFFDKVTAAAAVSLPIERTCCDSRSNDENEPDLPGFIAPYVCPAKQRGTCLYYKQFEDVSRLYIFTHQHIVLPKRRQIPAADLNVVDEAFHSHLVRQIHVDTDDLASNAEWNFLERAITGRLPLLTSVRNFGITGEYLTQRAHLLRKEWQDQWTNVDYSNLDFSKVVKLSPFYYLLRELGHELNLTKSDGVTPLRSDSYRIRPANKGISVAWPRKHRLVGPTLMLDATADQEILKLVKPHIEFHEVEVQRDAHVTQIWENRVSKWAVLNAEKADVLRQKCQSIINTLTARYSTGVVITYKQLKDLLTVPAEWDINHFGNVRGIDIYKDHPVILVIGAHTPPIQQLEVIAGALIGDEDIALKLTQGETLESYRAYLGQELGVQVRVHPDPLIQALVEQCREAEGVQSVDRLRLVGRQHPAEVYILSSLPLPGIEVSKLTTLNDLVRGGTRAEILLDRFGGILPLQSEWLLDRAPNEFQTAQAAAMWIEKLTTDLPSGTYRRPGQRGRSPARYLARPGLPNPRAALEALVGAVKDFAMPQSNEPPTAIDTLIAVGGSFNPHARGRQVAGVLNQCAL